MNERAATEIKELREALELLSQDYKRMDELRMRAEHRVEVLEAALRPFAEVATRLSWDAEDHSHVIEAPAEDIGPGCVFCLMVSHFVEASMTAAQPFEPRPPTAHTCPRQDWQVRGVVPAATARNRANCADAANTLNADREGDA
jgi:hypothetical protein